MPPCRFPDRDSERQRPPLGSPLSIQSFTGFHGRLPASKSRWMKACFSGGGCCFGYDIVGKGELQPNRQVGIFYQIFNDFGRNGMSARAIAHKLNAAGEPGPRGGEWTPSTIHGGRRALDCILH